MNNPNWVSSKADQWLEWLASQDAYSLQARDFLANAIEKAREIRGEEDLSDE